MIFISFAKNKRVLYVIVSIYKSDEQAEELKLEIKTKKKNMFLTWGRRNEIFQKLATILRTSSSRWEKTWRFSSLCCCCSNSTISTTFLPRQKQDKQPWQLPADCLRWGVKSLISPADSHCFFEGLFSYSQRRQMFQQHHSICVFTLWARAP